MLMVIGAPLSTVIVIESTLVQYGFDNEALYVVDADGFTLIVSALEAPTMLSVGVQDNSVLKPKCKNTWSIYELPRPALVATAKVQSPLGSIPINLSQSSSGV